MRKRRLLHLVLALLAVQAVLSARMIQLQVIEHEDWAERARRSRLEKRTIPAERGRILDADGQVLAEDRRSFDLMLEYRDFRRGQAIAQLLELGLLVGEPWWGLDQLATEAETRIAEVLRWRPERFAGLGSRRRGDALYYLRQLVDQPRAHAEVLEAWALESELPFGAAFPEAGAAMRAAVALCRERVRDLERLLGERLEEPLWSRLEAERQRLERRIRQQALRHAAGVALNRGAWEVRGLLAADAAPSAAADARRWRVERLFALQDLAGRWAWDGSLDDLAQAIAPAEDQGWTSEDLGALLAQIEQRVPDDLSGLRRELVARVHRDRVARLVRGVAFEVVDRIGQDPEAFAGLQIEAVADRIYPGDVVPQLIGTVRIASESDLEDYLDQRSELQELGGMLVRSPAQEERYRELRRAFLRNTLRPGDVRGSSGLEVAFEEVLRGERGYLRALAGGEEEGEPLELEFVPPRPGRDLQITLSARLTAAAERAIASGYAIARDLYGSADPQLRQRLRQPKVGFAVLDLRDASVPVLATAPSYDREQARLEWDRLVADREAGYFRHRALGGNATGPQTPYPGSTFKPLIALLALERDPAAWNREIACDGHWLPPGIRPGGSVRPLSCKNHAPGVLNMHDALKRSCNTYFYTLAHELGWEPIWDRAHALGFGAPTGIEVVEQHRVEAEERETSADDGVRLEPAGPNLRLELGANYLGSRHRGFNGFTNARFGIGQVSVQASPLQMARFYGWLATGELLTPRLVREGAGGATAVAELPQVPLDPGLQALIAESLRAVTEDARGTAYDEQYRLDLFRVAGKTGTAQTGGDGPTHAWFAGYFPWDEPRWAFAILCENADLHGGEIANLILHQFLSSEEALEAFGHAHE